ncbi:HTTM domain-containing protein [Winogradskyella maritima]|uniref:HTTM domain-containing protein n=1 Tax=Winogradskyella maritima TaxID=1517766 RepID=A0ABV8AF05_9FLAO|nr:HTTM domain-containing protein [Winogradskyella maritima]
MKQFLNKPIDNSGLIVFRILFGLLCFLESAGAIATGWVRRNLVEPEATFNFIGFDFLQVLQGPYMYWHYAIMSLFGIGIMLGYKYRWSVLAFTLMWTCTYLMQKSSYNNHYYLLMLLSALMAVLPANRYASLDVKFNPSLKSLSMPNWCRWLIISQLFIVYTFASIAKFYPDWLDGSVMALLMKSKSHYFLVGELLQQKAIHYFLSYGGILFDGLIIPALLYKPTRKFAFFISIFFHLFNSFIFHIGIFPYLSLAFSLFFFDAETIRKLFLKKKPSFNPEGKKAFKPAPILMTGLIIYLIIQVALPLRHHFIQDDVLWTEEGHRLSWRMMLRAKSGSTTYTVIDKATNNAIPVNLNDFLSKKQQRTASTKPDVMWQFAHRLKQHFAKEGKDVSVFVKAYVSVNGKPRKQFTDPTVDIASLPWRRFAHSEWLLPSK